MFPYSELQKTYSYLTKVLTKKMEHISRKQQIQIYLFGATTTKLDVILKQEFTRPKKEIHCYQSDAKN